MRQMSGRTMKFSRHFGNGWWDSVCVTTQLLQLRFLRGWTFACFARCRCHLKWRHPTSSRIAVSQDYILPCSLTFSVSVPVVAVMQTLRCFLQCKDVVLPISSDDEFDDFLHLLCTSLAVGHWPSLSPDLVITWLFPFETMTFTTGGWKWRPQLNGPNVSVFRSNIWIYRWIKALEKNWWTSNEICRASNKRKGVVDSRPMHRGFCSHGQDGRHAIYIKLWPENAFLCCPAQLLWHAQHQSSEPCEWGNDTDTQISRWLKKGYSSRERERERERARAKINFTISTS